MVFQRKILSLLYLCTVSLPAIAANSPAGENATNEMEVSTPQAKNWLMFTAGGSGAFDDEVSPSIGLECRFGIDWLNIHPWLAVEASTDGAKFYGLGGVWEYEISDRWIAGVGFGPGYYERNDGKDLGNRLEFLSFLEVSYTLPWTHRLSFRLAHISNGSLSDINPGTELLTLGYAIPFK